MFDWVFMRLTQWHVTYIPEIRRVDRTNRGGPKITILRGCSCSLKNRANFVATDFVEFILLLYALKVVARNGCIVPDTKKEVVKKTLKSTPEYFSWIFSMLGNASSSYYLATKFYERQKQTGRWEYTVFIFQWALSVLYRWISVWSACHYRWYISYVRREFQAKRSKYSEEERPPSLTRTSQPEADSLTNYDVPH